MAEEEGIAQNLHFHRTVAHLVESIPKGRIMILVRRYISLQIRVHCAFRTHYSARRRRAHPLSRLIL